MKKFTLSLFIACCLFLQVTAQEENISYIQNNGFYVGHIDSADYIRIVKPNEKGSKLFQVLEFYKSGKRKSLGYSNWPKEINYEDQFMSFFENGARKQSMKYAKGKVIDTVYSFYPNGRIYSIQACRLLNDSTIYEMCTVNDSTGRALVRNGNGSAVLYDEDFKYITGKGNIKNGKYDGEWSGELRSHDTLYYKEIYEDGKMIKGESTDGKGNVYHYTQSEIAPSFKGGINNFYRQVGSQIRYPADLAERKVQGTVRVNYTVLANGEVSNIHATSNGHPGLSAEAIRVLKTAKRWSPGAVKGRNVDVNFSMPMSFTLGL